MPGLRLCRAEREEIRAGLERGDSFRQIGQVLGRAGSTVWREVARNGGRGRYRAVTAQRWADERARRPKPSKLAADRRLAVVVRRWLDKGWSPAPIAHHLRARGWLVSAETIYRECYRPGGALGDDAWQLLCRRRPTRRRYRRTRTGIYNNPLGKFRSIAERPAVDGPGHWEGDLLVGARNQSAAAVLVERETRYTIVAALSSRNADHVAEAITTVMGPIPPPLRRTLTWDQGREIAAWPDIEHTLGTDLYICRPRSPWEKPLVEHTNGILRRWLPRKANLYQPQHQLDRISKLINTMPRRSLGWDTAQNQYDQLRVATAS